MLAKRRPTPLIEVRAKATLCRPSVWIQQGAPGKLRGDGRAAVDVELSKRCFQATRTVKFAKMAKTFPPDSAKTPGLRVTPPRMPKLQRAKKRRYGAHFRIRPLFLRTDFLKLKKKYRLTLFREFGRQNGAPWPRGTARWFWQAAPVPLATRGQVPCPLTGPGLQNASFKKKRGGTDFWQPKKQKNLKTKNLNF